MIEKELKMMLSKEEYQLLMDKINWDYKINQKNYYYFDENSINLEEKTTIRIREIDNQFKLQLKLPIKKEGAIHIKKEIEKDIEDIPKELSKEFLTELSGQEIGTAKLIGVLSTERFIYKWNDKIEFCLDKNNYLNIQDYELEVEYEDELSEDIFGFLDLMELNYRESTIGKCTRFVKKLGELLT